MIGVIVGLLMCCSFGYSRPVINDTFPSKSHLVLPEIQIKGNALVAKRRGDTLVFSADRFKRPEAFRLDQLLNNVPGFQVDPNGNISYNGRPIKKLMLDGDDLTAENYQLISRNLRSMMVDSIQVLERYNENRLVQNLTGNNDIAVNLLIKQSFYGRQNVNLIAAFASKRYGELQAELVRLSRKNKHMLVLNANNIGSQSLQNQLLDEQLPGNKQKILFRSWPDLLSPNLNFVLENKYINQNNDWGVAVVSSLKLNNYNQLRINIRKSTDLFSTAAIQHQEFFVTNSTPLLLFSQNNQKRTLKSYYLLFHWDHDKGKQQRTSYELEGYIDQNSEAAQDIRQLTNTYRLNSDSKLASKGIRFRIEHTWRTADKHIWLYETNLNSSVNNYGIQVKRNDTVQFDSIQNNISQLNYHDGIYIQSGLGHFRTTKTTIVRLWLRASLSKLNSIQEAMQVHLLSGKKYLLIQATKTLSKKVNFDMQSMVGYIQTRLNTNNKGSLIYHHDQLFVWKPKATRPLSINYGIVKQEAQTSQFFAGPIFSNSSLQIAGPSIVVFPITFYGQLSFSLLDLYRGINLNTQLTIHEVKQDYLTAATIYPFYAKISQLSGGKQTKYSLTMNLEKIVHPIRIKYRFLINRMQMIALAQFNAESYCATNNITSIKQQLSTNWKRVTIFNWSINLFIQSF